jgi:CelD/BcsL family acetyltransferase involved in cellulose biosynthesis
VPRPTRDGAAEPPTGPLVDSVAPADADVDVPVTKLELAVTPIAAEWDLLAESCNAAPFLRPAWIQIWCRAFGAGGTLEVMCVRRGGRLVAVMPFLRRGSSLRSPTNFHSPFFGLLAEDVEAARALASTLMRSHVRRVAVGFLESGSPDFAELTAAGEAARRRLVVRTLIHSPYLTIEGSWEAYEKALSRNLRADVRRCWRRLGEAGEISFEVSDGRTRLTQLLDEGFRLEAAGWRTATGTAILSRPETERFYREAARWAAERGWLRLAFLRVDERPIAFHYAFDDGVAYYPLKGGYDPRYREFSPGKLIIHSTLARAFSTGLARYEFLGGEAQYKQVWASGSREILLLQAFSRSGAGLADWAIQAYARPVAKSVVLALRRLRRPRRVSAAE